MFHLHFRRGLASHVVEFVSQKSFQHIHSFCFCLFLSNKRIYPLNLEESNANVLATMTTIWEEVSLAFLLKGERRSYDWVAAHAAAGRQCRRLLILLKFTYSASV